MKKQLKVFVRFVKKYSVNIYLIFLSIILTPLFVPFPPSVQKYFMIFVTFYLLVPVFFMFGKEVIEAYSVNIYLTFLSIILTPLFVPFPPSVLVTFYLLVPAFFMFGKEVIEAYKEVEKEVEKEQPHVSL